MKSSSDTGFHNVQPNQRCRIVTIQLAIPADADIDQAYDEISAMLSGAVASDNSNILDWRYPTEYMPEITANENPYEGEIFNGIAVDIRTNVISERIALKEFLLKTFVKDWTQDFRWSECVILHDYGGMTFSSSAMGSSQPERSGDAVAYHLGSGWKAEMTLSMVAWFGKRDNPKTFRFVFHLSAPGETYQNAFENVFSIGLAFFNDMVKRLGDPWYAFDMVAKIASSGEIVFSENAVCDATKTKVNDIIFIMMREDPERARAILKHHNIMLVEVQL